MNTRRVCVYCGSHAGHRAAYGEAASAFGRAIAEARWGLVYGGGRTGLMGAVADAARHAGAPVTGVIPRAFDHKEVAHYELEDLRFVANMHERKKLMADLSHAFVALPGGIGTLEELFEAWTWATLGFHGSAKPVGLLNVDGYYDDLIAFLDRAVRDGFLKAPFRDGLIVETDPVSLMRRMRDRVPA